MSGIDSLLLNVLFLIVFLLFLPQFLDRSLKIVKNEKAFFVFSACIAIILCLSFPIVVVDGFIFDLRWVPLIAGTFYSGLPASLLMFATTISYRFMIGGEGALTNLVVCIVLAFLLILLIKKFHQVTKVKKLLIGSSLAIIVGGLQLSIFYSFYDIRISFLYLIIYTGLLTLSSIIIIYSLEVIHEEKIINSRLLDAEKMEIVSQLASSISHEVRNPLTVVRGFLQMMEQTNISREERKKFLKLCIEEIDRANLIICEYLSFAKPSDECVEIVDVKNEIERAIEIIKPLANMNSVEVEGNIQSFYIHGQPQLLQQCLLNITKNCIEAMPNSGMLKIETKSVNHSLLIIIKDNGIGMTEEQVARIGEPYYTTKGKNGNGLGMVAVFKIVEMMKGKLDIISELNKGTTFQISLPIVNEEQDRSA